MALVRAGLGRLAEMAAAAQTAATEIGRVGAYVARTFGAPAGLRGLAVEWAWLAAHLVIYPAGLLREQLAEPTGYRTDSLPPVRRSLLITDVEAAGTPILLVHGIMDNRSVFTVFRRSLRRRGFGAVHAVNYSFFTGDIRTAAYQLRGHVEELRERTGADKVHIVGHSLGGMIARYYVQRSRHAGHARQPAQRHPHGPSDADPAGPPAATGLRSPRGAQQAGARLFHPVPGRLEPDGPDGRSATQCSADAPRSRRRGVGAM
jgi:pimeloyl-ACP methyl ester carboxylesterase